MFSTSWRILVAAVAVLASARTQEWSAEKLATETAGFQSGLLKDRLAQVGGLLQHKANVFPAMVARLHGDHREYRLKIDQLLDQLADPRWQVREDAERTLIDIGGPARAVIEQKKEKFDVLEQNIRCARILDALGAKGTAAEDRERQLVRGLVTTALYWDADPRLSRALRSALGHTDSSIVDGAIRALGKLGGDEDATAVAQMVPWKGGVHRLAAVSALGRMHSAKAAALCRQVLDPKPTGDDLAGTKPSRTEIMAIVRALHSHGSDPDATALLQELAKSPDPVVAAGATIVAPDKGGKVNARFTLPDRTVAPGTFGGFFGDSQLALGVFEGLPAAELSFADCDTIEFPDHAPVAATKPRIFLNQGSLLMGDLVGVDAETVRVVSPWFGSLAIPRREVQGIALDPELDRLVGASVDHDRVRRRDGTFVEGRVAGVADGKITIDTPSGGRTEVVLTDVSGLLLQRPRVVESDATTYSRVDLVGGERLIGFVADSSSDHLAVVLPIAGASVLPLSAVTRIETGVGGGAMWGFTLIADYSDNRVFEVDEQGRVVFEMNDVFGAWDAECLDNGNLLITEFAINRVQEVDRKGKTVWAYEDLKNPYDADRLSNGNTLIADTFGSRVIEVSPDKKVVWSYAKDIRPYDADRLPNGNTLIADMLKDRVIEVSPAGEIVWEMKDVPNVHDADRLPNGNTLITQRNKGLVIEVDRDGRVVWQLTGLSSPSDADRLPNGNTLVAENQYVREFDRRGNEVWRKPTSWAVEVNRY